MQTEFIKYRYSTQGDATAALTEAGFTYLGVANGRQSHPAIDKDFRDQWTAWSGPTSRVDADATSKTFWVVWES